MVGLEPMEIPDVAIGWLVQYAKSNSELAVLSNVSRRWRQIALSKVVELGQLQTSKSSKNPDGPSTLLLLSSMVRALVDHQQSTDNENATETFCIAWFHPEGMATLPVPLGGNDSDDDLARVPLVDDTVFAPSGGQSYGGSEEEGEGTPRRQRGRSRSPTPLLVGAAAGLRRVETQTKQVRCLYQWNGYREALEVLQPFGYNPGFVNSVIEMAQSTSKAGRYETAKKSPGHVREGNHVEQSTFAVRGATFARPEGYCLCWDVDYPVPMALVKNGDDAKSGIRQQENKELVKRRNRRRLDLQRLVLPRVLGGSGTDDNRRSPRERRAHQCTQFLNVDGNHAVRLFTPEFKPRPYRTPITIFCIAIATEDGCFLSGLKSRFEFGHLYPKGERDKMIERSPICICTQITQSQLGDSAGKLVKCNVNGDANSSNSDDSSCDMSMDAVSSETGYRCKCQFASITDSVNNFDDEAIPTALYRGRRCPGHWHCYVAVIDGRSSNIRMDGVDEPVDLDPATAESFAASLDGLTIGSDHTFDMSLCFGQGSDGEGEGAMAELVVFKGRLDPEDISAIERHLMVKHNIPATELSNTDLVQEDQWRRQAHALLTFPPHYKIISSELMNVPLRCLARHRSVAWNQSNAVSGEAIKVQRIGSSRVGNSSSDW